MRDLVGQPEETFSRNAAHIISVLLNFKRLINGNFHLEICDIFLIFAQNIDCGYMLEPWL